MDQDNLQVQGMQAANHCAEHEQVLTVCHVVPTSIINGPGCVL